MHLRVSLAVLLAIACSEKPAPAPAAEAPPAETRTKSVEASPPSPPSHPPIARDLPAIQAEKQLHVLFTFNSTGYFVYRGLTRRG